MPYHDDERPSDVARTLLTSTLAKDDPHVLLTHDAITETETHTDGYTEFTGVLKSDTHTHTDTLCLKLDTTRNGT